MSDKPRRALFQIHLSTAIVLMVVAGGIIGLNLRGTYSMGERFTYGWPYHWIEIARYESISDVYRRIVAPSAKLRDTLPDFTSLTIDVFSNLALLITFGLVTELLLRRREACAP